MVFMRVFLAKERKGEGTAGMYKLLVEQNLIFARGRPLNPS